MANRSESLQLVIERNSFYRNNYRRFVSILIVQSLAMLLMTTVLYYVVVVRPTTAYFASTPDGILIRLQPLTQPIKSDQFVAQWAAKAAQQVFTFDWVNYRAQMSRASDNFTRNGYNSLITSMNKNNYFQLVTQRRMIVSSVTTGPPVIVNRGILNGIYRWRISMQLLVKYQGVNENDTITVPLTVDMTVQRVSQEVNIRGIGISEFQAAQG
jgi:intracellular multiplication protein IcmL